jgi:hypothetical protein
MLLAKGCIWVTRQLNEYVGFVLPTAAEVGLMTTATSEPNAVCNVESTEEAAKS